MPIDTPCSERNMDVQSKCYLDYVRHVERWLCSAVSKVILVTVTACLSLSWTCSLTVSCCSMLFASATAISQRGI